MALSPAEEQEYQNLIAQYDRPDFLSRVGSGLGNLASTIPQDIIGMGTGVLNMVSANPLERVEVPKPLPIPEAQSLGEAGTDLIPGAAEAAISFFLAGWTCNQRCSSIRCCSESSKYARRICRWNSADWCIHR